MALTDSTPRAATWGRDEELSTLRVLLEQTHRGAGAVVLIEGEGGIGKSRLVDELTADARQSDFEVYAAAGEELERSRVLGPVRNALGAELSGRARPTDGDNATVAEVALAVLEERTVRRPVLMVLEDLHWADVMTLAFVSAASRRFDGSPLLLVATLRPPHGMPDLAHLVERLAEHGCTMLRLPPLDDGAVAQIVGDILGAEPSASLLSEVARASGNPFYVVELVHALMHEGTITIDAGRASLHETAFPASLRLTILRRLSTLPAESLDLLRTAAMLGSAFTAPDLAIVTRRPASDLLLGLRPPLSAGFLREMDDDRIGFQHDIVHNAVYEDVPASLRKAIHRQIADAFIQAGREPVAIAVHMARGAERGDEEAVAWLLRAAADAGTSSPSGTSGAASTKTMLLTRAAELCRDDDPRRIEALARSVMGLVATNEAARAVELATELLADALPASLEPLTRDGFAVGLRVLGRLEDARAQWEIVRDHPRTSPELRTRTLSQIAECAIDQGRWDEAASIARDILKDSKGSDDPWPPCSASTVLSLVAGAKGRVREAFEHASEGIPYGERDWERTAASLSRARVFAALARADADDFDGAIAEVRRDQRRLDGAQLAIPALERQVALAALGYIHGDWDEALAEVQSALEVGYEERVGTFAGIGVAARIHAHRGDANTAAELVRRGEEELASYGPGGIGVDLLVWAKACLERDAGRPGEALGLLEFVWDAMTQMRFAFSTWRHIWPDFVRLALELGRSELAAAIADAATEGGRAADGVGSAHFSAAWIEGLARTDAEAIVFAADGLRGTPRAIEAARCCEDAGLALRDTGDERAPTYLTHALDGFERLGATRDVDRIRAHLRELGVHLGARGPRRRPTIGWEALTAGELRVVALVAQGLTNVQIGDRLFISRRTVQTHLRNVFAKLGVSSRAAVATEAARH